MSNWLVTDFIELKLKSRNNAQKICELEDKLLTLYNNLKQGNQEDLVAKNSYLLQMAFIVHFTCWGTYYSNMYYNPTTRNIV